MPFVEQPEPWIKRHRWPVLGAALVLVLAAVVWIGILAFQRADEAKYQQAITKADLAIQANKLDESIRLYQGYLDQTRFDTHKTDVKLRLAAVYTGQKNYDAALAIYRDLESHGQSGNLQVVVGIADTSAAKGDKATAIANYKKAIELRKNIQSPTGNLYVQQYQAAIDALEKAP
jgi:predicted negative regulator of RcsB-dependent stress response